VIAFLRRQFLTRKASRMGVDTARLEETARG